jgi:hypothetical protein
MSVSGTWKLTIDTPMGRQESTLELTEDGSTLSGTASSNGEVIDIFDGSVDGDNVTWKVKITKPISVTATLTGTVNGDEISGHAKAGFFPAAPFTGVRV